MKSFHTIIFNAASLLALPSVGLAQSVTLPEDPEAMVGIFTRIGEYFLGIVAIAAFFYIIYAGFLITTSGDNSDKVTQGRKTLTYAVIGFIVALLAGAIVSMIGAAARVE